MKHLRVIIQIATVAVLAVSVIIAVFYGIISAIVVFVCFAIAGCLIAGWLLFYMAISRKSDKIGFLSAPHNIVALNNIKRDSKEDSQRRELHDLWRKQFPPEEVTIRSVDGLELYGIIIRNSRDEEDIHRWAVVCHGYADIGKEKMMFIAQTFHEMGYWVLMPDARGHGKSGGDTMGMGWPDRMDILRWIHEIGARDNAAEIVLYGISLGASTVLMVSGEPLPSSVKAIVADSGYTSAAKEFAYQLKKLYNLPAFPIIQVCSLFTRIYAGYWLGEASSLRQIAKSVTPILLIHGSADTFVPPSMMMELYESAVCFKQKMLVEGAGHGQTPLVGRQHYWQTISDFLALV